MSTRISLPVTVGPIHVLQHQPQTFTSKATQIATIVLKLMSLCLLMYLFICSLNLLSSSFRLIGGKAAGKFISNSNLLANPIVGLMIGVLVTVLVQSSSTSTSIVVTMVGSDLIRVTQAIPIIMGANIGTSVTNTIVSLMQASEREEFKRAFAAATVHDMFNWLTVMVLLPLEMSTGYLLHSTNAILSLRQWHTDAAYNESTQAHTQDEGFMKMITKPLIDSLVKLDKKVLEEMATDPNATTNKTILVSCTSKSCGLLNKMHLGDEITGFIVLFTSLALLCGCLILVVKLLHSMLQGKIAILIEKYINGEYKFPMSLFIGYFAIVIGCVMTILVQSSSIFTSALTPLAGIGVISLERIYPLTLGSNIGTTTTGIMAALAADSKSLRNTLQLALCHLLFNLSGILLFYPIPWMRFPITLAKALGNTTVKYRWFSIFYLAMMFFLLPLTVFVLSSAGPVVFTSVGVPILLVIILAIVITTIQRKKPAWLPRKLQTWNWLPLWMHSLDPIDDVFRKLTSHCACLASDTRHDAAALGIRANQSQLHILEAAKHLSSSDVNICDNGAASPTHHWSHHHTFPNHMVNQQSHPSIIDCYGEGGNDRDQRKSNVSKSNGHSNNIVTFNDRLSPNSAITINDSRLNGKSNNESTHL